jgi:hypothetical protein
LTYRNWIEAVRAGRTFVTGGPLVFLNVEGHEPGGVVELASSSQPVRARAEARGVAEFETLEVVANGAIIGTATASGSPCAATLEVVLAPPASGWIAARCWKGQGEGRKVVAHSSPVYVGVAGQLAPANPDAAALVVDHLDAMLSWVAKGARVENEQQRARLAGLFQSARDVVLARVPGSAG